MGHFQSIGGCGTHGLSLYEKILRPSWVVEQHTFFERIYYIFLL